VEGACVEESFVASDEAVAKGHDRGGAAYADRLLEFHVVNEDRVIGIRHFRVNLDAFDGLE
jgi:hypothetical protein